MNETLILIVMVVLLLNLAVTVYIAVIAREYKKAHMVKDKWIEKFEKVKQPRKGGNPNKRKTHVHLTDRERKDLCQYVKDNPELRHEDLAELYGS